MSWGLIRKGLGGEGIPGEVTIGGTAGVKVLRKEGVELRGFFLEKRKVSNHQAIFIYCYYSVTSIMLGDRDLMMRNPGMSPSLRKEGETE